MPHHSPTALQANGEVTLAATVVRERPPPSDGLRSGDTLGSETTRATP